MLAAPLQAVARQLRERPVCLTAVMAGVMIGARLNYVCHRGESGRVMPYRLTPLIFASTLVLVSLAALFAGPSTPALAAIYVVDTTSDLNLITCAADAGDCSLRGAINNANASAGGDTI